MTGPDSVTKTLTLASLIRRDREALLARWRHQVKELPSARGLDVPALNDHIPQLLEELAFALEVGSDLAIDVVMEEGTPAEHGVQRVHDGFDIVEVVSEYNILRECIHDLADSHGVILNGRSFHILNHTFNRAIGLAVSAYAALRERQLQERRQEYLAFVAHDLRTPLNAITLAQEMLEALHQDGPTDPQMDLVIRTLNRNATQLKVLVEKVLEENQHVDDEAGIRIERRCFDLWPVSGAVIRALQLIAATNSTRLVNEVPSDLVVYADAQLVQRVLQNIVQNAITYAPGGEVRIQAAARTDGSIDCRVTDNGQGIPPDQLPWIFEKGVGDPSKEESRGLGLAMVKTYVEAHGGTVQATSEVGKGTTISFTLPGKPLV